MLVRQRTWLKLVQQPQAALGMAMDATCWALRCIPTGSTAIRCSRDLVTLKRSSEVFRSEAPRRVVKSMLKTLAAFVTWCCAKPCATSWASYAALRGTTRALLSFSRNPKRDDTSCQVCHKRNACWGSLAIMFRSSRNVAKLKSWGSRRSTILVIPVIKASKVRGLVASPCGSDVRTSIGPGMYSPL